MNCWRKSWGREMSEQTKKLVPNLRFPKFKNAGEWVNSELGILAIFVNEKISINQLTINNYVSTENILPDYAGLVPASKLPSVENATRFKVSDILISNIRPYLKKVSLAEIDGGSSNDVIVVRASTKVNPIYLSYILRNDSFIEYVMDGAKGVKMPRGDISMIKEYPVPYPKPEEQQKIADCLSSLDDLINAQNQKVEALKQHKKGLMQQLFPVEGEIVPKLRFPEFENDGDWLETALEDCLDYLQPTPYLVTDTNYNDSYNTPVLTAGKTFILGYTNEEEGIFSQNLPVIIFDDFTTASQFVDFPFKAKSSAMKILLAKNGANVKFIYELLQVVRFEVGAHERHWISTFATMKVLVPSPEEQRAIANCLTSVDALTVIQTQKLEAYKTHKKGLMQQLFPSLDEV
jgi:type I restriction enzyme, S subunit